MNTVDWDGLTGRRTRLSCEGIESLTNRYNPCYSGLRQSSLVLPKKKFFSHNVRNITYLLSPLVSSRSRPPLPLLNLRSHRPRNSPSLPPTKTTENLRTRASRSGSDLTRSLFRDPRTADPPHSVVVTVTWSPTPLE